MFKSVLHVIIGAYQQCKEQQFNNFCHKQRSLGQFFCIMIFIVQCLFVVVELLIWGETFKHILDPISLFVIGYLYVEWLEEFTNRLVKETFYSRKQFMVQAQKLVEQMGDRSVIVLPDNWT